MAEYKVNYTQSNFTGGIIATELYGRNDFNKVKTGLKTCTNWTIRELVVLSLDVEQSMCKRFLVTLVAILLCPLLAIHYYFSHVVVLNI